MEIKDDKTAQELIGTQVHLFSENKLVSTVVTEVILTKKFGSVEGALIESVIKTAIGEFPSEEIFQNRDDIIKYIDETIQR